MTKKDIVKSIAGELNLPQVEVKKVVQMTLESIVEALEKKGRIELRNFGVFEVKARKPRKARNPRTNEVVFVPAKKAVTFKPGKEMEERIK